MKFNRGAGNPNDFGLREEHGPDDMTDGAAVQDFALPYFDTGHDADQYHAGSDYDDALNALAFHARPYDDESKKEPTRTRSV